MSSLFNQRSHTGPSLDDLIAASARGDEQALQRLHAAHLDGFDADRLDEVYGAGQTDQLALLEYAQRARVASAAAWTPSMRAKSK